MEDNIEEFRYRLLKVMAEKDISPAELSRRSGVDKGALSNYINGKYAAKKENAYKLAKALGVNPGWLLTGDEPVQRSSGIINILAGSSMPLSLDDLPALREKLSPSTPKEDAEMSTLWLTATIQAKRAAIAVLKSMKEAELE